MDVLILAGYRDNIHQTAFDSLDLQIQKTQALGLNPIVVLAGNHAEDILRTCPALRTCELVFDTNDSAANLMTNLRAGVQAASETCFVLPLDIPCPEKEVWVTLKRAFQRSGFSTRKAIVQLTDGQGAPWHWGFPLYITRLGRHLLINESDLTSLIDPRLTYFHSVFGPPEGLAPQGDNL